MRSRTSTAEPDLPLHYPFPLGKTGALLNAANDTVYADKLTTLSSISAHRVQVLKGLERPIQIYRVVQPSGMRWRFDVATAAGGLTPFVGRDDELRSLMNRWERALAGEGQVALIIGEAGIGKSRLLRRFHEQIAGKPHTWIEAGGGRMP